MTRRTHNKTRLGCSQCKKRRIKCDCTHPVCENCKKRGQECSFLLLAPSSQLTAWSASQTSTSDSSAASSSTSASSDQKKPSSSTQVTIIPKRPSEVLGFHASASYSPRSSPSPTPISLPNIELPQAFTNISPHLRLNDVWKDTRETLSPALQGLLYHYEYTTALTLASNDPAKSTWQAHVPELAFSHTFLVHHILAVASLHIGRLHGDGTERWTMNNVAAAQMNKAISRFRPELENVNAENAAALFASATLTAVYFFRTSTMEIDEIRASVPAGTIVPSSTAVDHMMHSVLRTIYGLRGPLTVLISGWQFVMEGKMSTVANRNWWPKDRVPATDRAREEDARLAGIARLWQNLEYGSDINVDCIASALFYLRETYALVSQLTLPSSEYPSTASISYSIDDTTIGYLKDRGAMFVWATRISRDFIKLVEQKNREALVIVAHYAVLAGRVRNAWWLEGLGANMIIAVAMALGRENWHLIDWPAKIAGVDLENAFSSQPDKLEGKPGEMPMEVI